MDAASRARWRCVATVVGLVCMAAQLSVVTALPAPPTVTGAQSLLDIATPPPITEDELHQMVEQLLMEAYGDEYEPPPPRLKAKNTGGTTPSFASTSTSSFSSPQIKSMSDNGITESLLLLQQQQKMAEIQEQRQKLHEMQKQLHVEQQQHQEQQLQMVRQSTNTPPITKGSLIIRQQLKQGPRNVPSPVPTLEKPRVLHGQNTNAPQLRLTTRPPVLVQPPISVQPSPVTTRSKPRGISSPVSVQPPPVTARSKPRGIPTPEELQKALVFQQENQPGVLIVDRRKKSKTGKSKGARQLLLNLHHNNHQASGRTPITSSFTPMPTTTTTMHHHTQTPPKQLVIKRGRSSSPTTTPTSLPMHSSINNTKSPSIIPARSLKRETKPESLEGDNLASRNGRSPQRNSAKQEQQVERKAPVIESAKLLSHIVSEDMRPFHKVQNSNRQIVSSSAPRPFTLPSPVNNPAQIQRPQEQQKPLTVDLGDEDLLMLQRLGSQLNQAARVQSTQNLQLSQPQNSGQASFNNQAASLQFVMQPRRNKDNNRVVINLGNMAKQLQSPGVPLPMNVASNTHSIIINSRNNDQAKAISSLGNTFQDFSSSTQKLNPVNQNLNQRLTVGDLVMSLNGQNGIRVVSLGDLRNDNNFGSSVTHNDADLLQQLRNAMISGNINSLNNQQMSFGVPLPNINQGFQRSNVGVPLPTLVNQNQQGSNAVDSGNAGRQFDFLFANQNQNSQNTVDFNSGGSDGGGVINDLLFDASISVGRPGDSIPQSGGAGSLDDFFVNANSGSGPVPTTDSSFGGGGNLDDIFGSSDPISSNTGSVGVPLPATTNLDPLPDSFGTSDTGDFALEDNTDFDFGSYEDDFPPLPPQPPNVFRTGISDIFFTKGQWIGTLLGGLFDVGSAVGSSVSKLFKKGSSETST